MLRVLHVRSSSFYGSPEKLILAQIRELKHRFLLSAVILRDGAGTGTEDACRQEGIPTYGLAGFPLIHLARIINESKFDVVCTHDYKANFYIRFLRLFFKFKQVAVFHGRTSHDAKSKFYEGLDSLVLRSVSAIVAVSHATKASLSRYGDDVHVIHNAYVEDKEVHITGEALRREWGLPEGALVIGTAGRLSSEKGHLFLINVMKEILETRPHVVLVIAGEGDQKLRLVEAIQSLGLGSSVRLVGFRRDMRAFYESLDIFVLPSDREGLPLVLLEAGARALPTVATDVGGVREVIDDKRSGLLVTPRDHKMLGKALLQLIDNKEDRRRLGAEMQKKVAESFNVKKYAQKYYELFTQVASEDAIWISWEEHRRSREISKALGIRCFELLSKDSPPIRYAKLMAKTLGLILWQRPSVVLIQCPSMILALWCVLLRPFLRYRLIIDGHNEAIEPYIHNTPRMKALARFIQRKAELVIVTNNVLKAIVEKNGGRPLVLPDKIPSFSSEPASGSVCPEKNIVFICTYAPDEPVADVVEAARLLPGDIRLHITGNSKKANPHMVQNAPKNVRFTGFLDENSYLGELKRANVLVDLTAMEDCLVCGAYEAVGLGKPLVTSDTRALRAYFSKGTLYARHDPQSLAAAMMEALKNEEPMIKEMGVLKSQLDQTWDSQFQELVSQVRGAR